MSLTSQVVPADLKDSVIIGDPVKFEAKKKKFLEGGKDALQVGFLFPHGPPFPPFLSIIWFFFSLSISGCCCWCRSSPTLISQ